MVLSLQATASKSLFGRENEKGVMFISSMVPPVNYDIF